jgi:hypothetical protein
MVSIIDDTVVDDLSDKADWRLGSINIEEWHVEIVHEIDESFTWWWTEGSSSSLINLRFNNDLKSFGVGVVIEVDGSIKSYFFVKCSKVILNDSGFTSTSGTDIEHSSSVFDVEIKEESLSSSFSSWDN